MDTDDLTPMAYQCLVLANDATDIMMTEFGAACSHYQTEDDYLRGVLKFTLEIEKKPLEYLDEWNLEGQINSDDFSQKIKLLLAHIQKTISIPWHDRGAPPEW